jgi:hypothetical protein
MDFAHEHEASGPVQLPVGGPCLSSPNEDPASPLSRGKALRVDWSRFSRTGWTASVRYQTLLLLFFCVAAIEPTGR